MGTTVLTPAEISNAPNKKVSPKMQSPYLGTIVTICTLFCAFLILVYTIFIAPLREDIGIIRTEVRQDFKEVRQDITELEQKIDRKFEEQRLYFESLIDRIIDIQQQNN